MKYFCSLFLLAILSTGLFAQSNYESGFALYYADYLEGRQTASGEIFSQRQLTAAHKSHPFGTLLKVTRKDNGMSVIVRVNDRGPFCDGCSVDLSRLAAERIDLIKAGKKQVHVQVVGFSRTNPKVLDTWSDVRNKTVNNYQKKATKPRSGRNDNLTTKGSTTARSNSKPKAYSTPKPAPKSVFDGDATAVRYLPIGQTGYFIQLGAYTLESNARRTLSDLQKRDVQYLYLQKGSTTPGKSITRMFLGPFTTQTKANEYLRDVCPEYGLSGIVVLLR
jgi:rare lipoprotein A